VTTLAQISYQPNWMEILTQDFMLTAFAAGVLVAVSAGLLGYFVVIRRSAFAAHALAHIGLPGATGAALVGLPVMAGLMVFCVGGALVIGATGRRVAEREVATGTVLAFATGLGYLFNSQLGRGAPGFINILFGNLLAVSADQLTSFALFSVLAIAGLATVARPLAFASVAPEVAEARGVPVRVLNIAFLVLLGLVVAMAVQVVGTLLLFSLVVTPAATALAITARPVLVVVLSTTIAVAAVIVGLVLAVMVNLSPSFVIVALATAAWAASAPVAALRRRRVLLDEGSPAGVVGGDQHARRFGADPIG
jgi:zinc/manganese transport system permease protein